MPPTGGFLFAQRAGMRLLARNFDEAGLLYTATQLSAWLWLPIVFSAYLIGRKQITIRAILTFTAAEAAAIFWYMEWF
jgi:hypothetical protein